MPFLGIRTINNGQDSKYRVVVDDEELAKQIAERLEMLSRSVPNAKRIAFDSISTWIKDANSISIKKVEY